MGEQPTSVFDLEPRTLAFAASVVKLAGKTSRTLANAEIVRQLVRASASVGANYIEANEALGQRDFLMHCRICRKEAKEARYWLRLITVEQRDQPQVDSLIQESTELMNIFGAIVRKCETRRA